MKSLFENETKDKIIKRLNKLSNTSKAEWGTMTAVQMLKHCQAPLEVGIGTRQLDTKIGFMKKLLFKAFKPTMYNDKPWSQNLPTAKDYIVTETGDFIDEKQKLELVIDEFCKLNSKTNWPKHPFFGSFTTEQWGKLQYKHLDHHFRQFGV